MIDEQDPKPSAKEDVETVENNSDDKIATEVIMIMTFILHLTDVIIPYPTCHSATFRRLEHSVSW